jgi:glycine cleavage system H protein
MSAVRFTRDHEWVRQEGDLAVIGITDYAQSQLGDVVYVELPELGRHVEQGKEAAVVESAKAASEVYAPVTGEVVAVNDGIVADPAKVNADAMGEGWFIKIRLGDPKQLEDLMDEAAYQAFVGEQP